MDPQLIIFRKKISKEPFNKINRLIPLFSRRNIFVEKTVVVVVNTETIIVQQNKFCELNVVHKAMWAHTTKHTDDVKGQK